MKILFLTQLLPYPLTGGQKIRAYYMLRQLVRDHAVTLVSFTRPDDRLEDIDHLREMCTAVVTVPMQRSTLKNIQSLGEGLFLGRSMVIARDRQPAMQAQLRKIMQATAFDTIHADQTAMAQYALFAQQAASTNPQIVLDQHNALYLVVKRQASHERGLLKRLLWQWEARKLARYEAETCRQFDHVLTVTQEDKEALLHLYPAAEARQLNGRFIVLPICVDPNIQPPLPRQDKTPQIIFLGTMFWPPNVEGVLWFAKEVLPLVAARVPDVGFKIVGKNPPTAVAALQTTASPLAAHIEVTGFVADVEPLLSGSRLFVVPLLAGGGMRVKIIDAWQWGLPVVSTTIGAEGIDVVNGRNILLADDPQTFAEAVISVLTDAELADRLRSNGRRYVEQQYNWRTVYKKLDEIHTNNEFSSVPPVATV